MTRDWDEHYATGEMPWDSPEAPPVLVALVEAGRLPTGRALDVGCGTGTNVRYLASVGYDAVGIDISPLAIEQARSASKGAAGDFEFKHADFLVDGAPLGPYDLVLDRGCFHVFDEADDRARFAQRVAECLSPAGLWMSIIGSTEGPPRDHGPPRRSARDIANAVEPALELVELRSFEFGEGESGTVWGWVLLAQRRRVEAQPSTRHAG